MIIDFSVSVTGGSFKGLLAQLRDGDIQAGKFIVPDSGFTVDGLFKTRCAGNAVSHANNQDKTAAVFRIQTTRGSVLIRPIQCV